MNRVFIDKVLAGYGVKSALVHDPNAGYRNKIQPVTLEDGRDVNIILYKHEAGITHRISNIHKVSRHLDDAGFSVRIPWDNRILRIDSGGHTRYGALYTYLPGSTIPWEAYTKHHIKLLGATLSNVHDSLKSFPSKQLRGQASVAHEYRYINQRMQAYFSQARVRGALETKLGLVFKPDTFGMLETLLDTCEREPGRQVLHMDFVRSNILFGDHPHEDDPASVAGILDLEKTGYGSRAFDLARTWAFLLVDCKYKTSEKIEKYFLESGYNKRGSSMLDDQTRHLAGRLLDLFLVHDFYKFLRHNPYEFLEENQHFQRTAAFLVQRGLVMAKVPDEGFTPAYGTILSSQK